MLRYFLLATFVVLAYTSTILGPESLAVTIYNNNFAIVKDTRKISFDEGESMLYFTDVSSNIQTETVTFKAINSPSSIRVYQQNFEQNLVNTNGVLKKYIEKEIVLFIELGGTSRRVSGKLLGYNSGYIVQTSQGIQIFNKIAGIEFPSLPDGFFTVPTLNWKVFSEKALNTSCEVAYRTTGFRWSADYSLTLNQDETLADLGGWVTIDNNSGKKYVDAKLKLIAGDVNTVSQPTIQPVYARAKTTSGAGSGFTEKSFADYHLYTLGRSVTLNQSSSKQVQFIPKVFNLPIEKYHEIKISAGGYSEQKLTASNNVRFLNSKQNGLGIALPKGIVRVFKEDDTDKSLQFIGENSINHTPKDQNITLTTGNAFDITSSKIVKSRISRDNKGGYSAEVNMLVTSHKNTKADVLITFTNNYGDNLRMNMIDNATAPEKRTATEFRWRKTLNPDQVWQFGWREDYSA